MIKRFILLFVLLFAIPLLSKKEPEGILKLTVTNQVILPDTTFALSVNVIAGWNMLSIPGHHPSGDDVNIWWPHKFPGPVFTFIGSYQQVSFPSTGVGYWVRNSDTRTYNTGDEWPRFIKVPHNPIPASSGWNMLGFYEDTIAVADLLALNPNIIPPIYGFNAGGYGTVDSVCPGYGYWARVSQASNIIVPSALPGDIYTLQKEEDKSEWGRLIISDASGKSFTLYSAAEGVNLDNFSMPPMPPAECFDVRYSSGRSAENLRTSSQGIDLSGVVYPVTITAEKERFRIQDVSGRQLSTILNPGERVTINNISKLLVSAEVIPVEYSLSQNYPNPFNPTTQITYGIPKAGLVTLKVYNSIGEETAVLVSQVQEPGKYTLQFNSAGLASGVYLYKLTSGEFTQTKKMILLK